jgi:hypothetical protein
VLLDEKDLTSLKLFKVFPDVMIAEGSKAHKSKNP